MTKRGSNGATQKKSPTTFQAADSIQGWHEPSRSNIGSHRVEAEVSDTIGQFSYLSRPLTGSGTSRTGPPLVASDQYRYVVVRAGDTEATWKS